MRRGAGVSRGRWGRRLGRYCLPVVDAGPVVDEAPAHVLLHVDELQRKVYWIWTACKPAVLSIFPQKDSVQVMAHAEEEVRPARKPFAALREDVLPHRAVVDNELLDEFS